MRPENGNGEIPAKKARLEFDSMPSLESEGVEKYPVRPVFSNQGPFGSGSQNGFPVLQKTPPLQATSASSFGAHQMAKKLAQNSAAQRFDRFNQVGPHTNLSYQNVAYLLRSLVERRTAEEVRAGVRQQGSALQIERDVDEIIDKKFAITAISEKANEEIDKGLRDAILKFVAQEPEQEYISILLCTGRRGDHGEIIGDGHWTVLHLRRFGQDMMAYHLNSLGDLIPQAVERVITSIPLLTEEKLSEKIDVRQEDGSLKEMVAVNDVNKRALEKLRLINFNPIVEIDCAKQKNSNDCGLFAVYNALLINRARDLGEIYDMADNLEMIKQAGEDFVGRERQELMRHFAPVSLGDRSPVELSAKQFAEFRNGIKELMKSYARTIRLRQNEKGEALEEDGEIWHKLVDEFVQEERELKEAQKLELSAEEMWQYLYVNKDEQEDLMGFEEFFTDPKKVQEIVDRVMESQDYTDFEKLDMLYHFHLEFSNTLKFLIDDLERYKDGKLKREFLELAEKINKVFVDYKAVFTYNYQALITSSLMLTLEDIKKGDTEICSQEELFEIIGKINNDYFLNNSLDVLGKKVEFINDEGKGQKMPLIELLFEFSEVGTRENFLALQSALDQEKSKPLTQVAPQYNLQLLENDVSQSRYGN